MGISSREPIPGPGLSAARPPAGWRIESGVGHFDITNGGTTTASVQLLQPGKALIQQEITPWEYLTPGPTKPATSRSSWRRLFSPFTDYSRITPPFLTPTPPLSLRVTMQQPSDFSANLLFNMGSSAADVFLDNISLFKSAGGRPKS